MLISLEKFNCPEISEVEDCTFYKCYNLKSVFLPNSIKKINDYAFYKCQKLKEISIPS